MAGYYKIIILMEGLSYWAKKPILTSPLSIQFLPKVIQYHLICKSIAGHTDKMVLHLEGVCN